MEKSVKGMVTAAAEGAEKVGIIAKNEAISFRPLPATGFSSYKLHRILWLLGKPCFQQAEPALGEPEIQAQVFVPHPALPFYPAGSGAFSPVAIMGQSSVIMKVRHYGFVQEGVLLTFG